MITFCLVFYIAVAFCMMFKCLFSGDGLEGVVIQFFGTLVFLILFIIGIIAFFKLYNIHFTIGA